jgi:hypothetical protein
MNSNIFKCEYCKSTFANKSNLSYHKKKAKFCLIKRGEEISRVIILDNICEYCDKNFSSKQRLLTHKEICYKKEFSLKEIQDKDTVIYTLKTENKNLREQIESLQQKLASIAIEGVRKPTKITNNTTTTNNVTQILSPFDLEQKDILCIIENNLDETSFLNSQRGIAKFCVDNILKTEDGKMRMICSDPSRERFKYMDDKGVIKDDIQARQFIEKIYPPIHQVGEKIHESIIEKCKTQNIKIAKGEDKTDKYLVKIREEAANNSWMEIRFIKSQTSNGTFRKELAILSNV